MEPDPKVKVVKVIRAWADIVITAWWEKGNTTGDEDWLSIRQLKSIEGVGVKEKTIRMSRTEAETLKNIICTRGEQ